MCKICELTSSNLLKDIEGILAQNGGVLTSSEKRSLCKKYREHEASIKLITDKDCELHYNFHQSVKRAPLQLEKTEESTTIAQDIGKDEATVLYELLNKQMATFNALSNKINKVIKDSDEENLKGMLFNPTISQFYKELGDGIRANVRELRDLNVAMNGKKDGSIEGLKALAVAIVGSRDKIESEMTTEEFD